MPSRGEPDLPLIAWIVLGLSPVAIAWLLAVEAWIVRPSQKESDRGGPGPP